MKLLSQIEKNKNAWHLRNDLYQKLLKEFHTLSRNAKDVSCWERINKILNFYLAKIALDSYREGCQEVAVNPDAAQLLKLKNQVAVRVGWVFKEIKDWTYAELQIKAASNPKKKKLFSKKRAKKIADNETYISFYSARTSAWRRNREARYEWVLGEEHGNADDVCDENADDGAIPTGQPFSSGDFHPPAHLGCYCRLWLHVPQNLLRLPGFREEKTRTL